MTTPFLRLILFFVVLFMVFVLPWWLTVVILLSLVIYFDFYMEVIFFGFLIDTLYMTPNRNIYPFFISSFIVLLLTSFVKTRIRT